MIHTKETKRKISKSRKGKNNPFYGKKHTKEAKEKMSEWTKNRNSKRQYDLRDVTISIPDDYSLNYLAGMIDADGSIRFKKNRPFVSVYNTSNNLMDWLLMSVGGSITGKDNRGREVSYTWSIGAAKDVYALCKALLPLLKIKAGDAQKAISFLEEKYKNRING